MLNKNYKIILALLIINKGEPLNNSYKLIRILEWKFRTVNLDKILDEIQEKNYAEYEIINGLHYYKLTFLGRELIKQEFDKALEFLLKNYPEEVEIITSLFKPFNTSNNEIKDETKNETEK